MPTQEELGHQFDEAVQQVNELYDKMHPPGLLRKVVAFFRYVPEFKSYPTQRKDLTPRQQEVILSAAVLKRTAADALEGIVQEHGEEVGRHMEKLTERYYRFHRAVYVREGMHAILQQTDR